MTALNLDVLVAVLHQGLTLEDANLAIVGIESVHAVFQQLCRRAIFLHTQQVVLIDLRDFDHRLTLSQRDFRVGQAGRNQSGGTVVSHTEKYAWGQQDLSFAGFGGERLAALQTYRSDGLCIQGLSPNCGLPFNVIECSR